MSANDVTIAQVRNIGRTYDGPPGVAALQECSLTIPAGDYMALMGRSGSGKSTLLHILGLLDSPTSGTYQLFGEQVQTLSARQRAAVRAQHIGFVFQAFHLIPYLTALENVELSLSYAAMPRSQRRTVATESLIALGLEHRLGAYPRTLSGGEQQRVAIGRAIAKRPKLVLCDEPTGSLDAESARTVLDTLDGLRDLGLTIVLVTHDLEVAARADHTLTIADGAVQSPTERTS